MAQLPHAAAAARCDNGVELPWQTSWPPNVEEARQVPEHGLSWRLQDQVYQCLQYDQRLCDCCRCHFE